MAIVIQKTTRADTRGDKPRVTRKELEEDTKLHIGHVIQGMEYVAGKMVEQAQNHDHTKLEYLDAFLRDFNSQSDETPFKSMWWWRKHLEERHHLRDRCPEDATIVDLAEYLVDYSMAAMAREGKVNFEKYPVNLPPETIEKILQNTISMIIYDTKVESPSEEEPIKEEKGVEE